MPLEVLTYLEPRVDGVYVDATVGGGGHAAQVLEATSPGGQLIGIDRDPAALEAAKARLEGYGDRVLLVRGRFAQVDGLLEANGIGLVDGVLADLGVSSPQLDHPERGFSFAKEGPLDMRMDPEWPVTAAMLVNEEPVEELARIFREYGEERYAWRVAEAIVQRRRVRSFESTRDLAGVLERVVPRQKVGARIHPATRVFQGLRIAVNDELAELEAGLEAAFSRLKVGGRLVIISFHSLEDRIVKQFLRKRALTCICPPEMPICRCSKVSEVRILTPKPVEAGADEVSGNPRARSARLRAAEKRAVWIP